MKILVILENYQEHLRHYFTDDLIMQEHYVRKHNVFAATVKDLVFNRSLWVNCTAYKPLNDSAEFKPFGLIEAKTFDYIYFRPEPPIRGDKLIASYLLENLPVKYCNHPIALRNFNEKIICLDNFSKYMTDTAIGGSREEVIKFANEVGWPILIKPLEEFQAHGVKKICKEQDVPAINELIMVQRFLQDVEINGSKRVLVVRDKVLGAISFLAKPGEYITNFYEIHAYKDAVPTAKEKAICLEATEMLMKNGIQFTAFDFIDEKLMEINLTSPGGVPEYNIHYKTTLEKEIVDILLG